MFEPMFATLAIGILLGYVGQRSRMCFVAGFRDFLLVRDTELLRGLLAFFVTAWLAFSIAGFFGLLDSPTTTPGIAGSSTPEIAVAQAMPVPGHGPAIAYAAGRSLTPTRHVVQNRGHETNIGLAGGWPGALRVSLPYSDSYLVLTLLAAFSLGFLSVLANGCPFRQHVLAGQGVSNAVYYLLGFYGGVLIYDRFVAHWLFRFL
jgi:uncharacterized membrane protein YedE/YeeE